MSSIPLSLNHHRALREQGKRVPVVQWLAWYKDYQVGKVVAYDPKRTFRGRDFSIYDEAAFVDSWSALWEAARR